MSRYVRVPNKLVLDNSLSDRARMVYIMLSTESPYPDTDMLAKNMGINKGTFNKYVKELVDAGWVERKVIRQNGRIFIVQYNLRGYEKEG